MSYKKQLLMTLIIWVILWGMLFTGIRGYFRAISDAMGNPPDRGCTVRDFPCCQLPDYPGCPFPEDM